MGRATESV